MSVSVVCRIARKLVFGKSVYKIVSSSKPISRNFIPFLLHQSKSKYLSAMPPKRKRENAATKEVSGKTKKIDDEDQENDVVETGRPRRNRAVKNKSPPPTPSDSEEEEKPKKTSRKPRKPKTKDVEDGDAKPSKGRKKKTVKEDNDEDEEEEEAKPAKGRRKAKVEPEIEKEDEISDDEEEEEVKPKGRKNAKAEKAAPAPAKNKTTTSYEEIDFDNCKKKNSKGEDWNFKISNWNVDGIRAWLKKGGLDFVLHEKPDIFCLQETKCSLEKLPDEVKEVDGYKVYWHCSERDSYAGVALYSKTEPISVEYGVGHEEQDDEGRMITAEYENFYVISVYVPNSGRGLVTLPKRLKWNDAFRNFVTELDKKKPVVICGDMNVAHLEIDLTNPKTNTKNAGFTKEERDGMTEFLDCGYIDTFRNLYPDKAQAYTFWTYFGNCRAKNVGWRLDYFIVSKRLMDSVCDNVIRSEVFGSDHCPITLFMYV